MITVFRDVALAQLTAAFLYEMSKLMKEEAVERVNLMILSFVKHITFLLSRITVFILLKLAHDWQSVIVEC